MGEKNTRQFIWFEFEQLVVVFTGKSKDVWLIWMEMGSGDQEFVLHKVELLRQHLNADVGMSW